MVHIHADCCGAPPRPPQPRPVPDLSLRHLYVPCPEWGLRAAPVPMAAAGVRFITFRSWTIFLFVARLCLFLFSNLRLLLCCCGWIRGMWIWDSTYHIIPYESFYFGEYLTPHHHTCTRSETFGILWASVRVASGIHYSSLYEQYIVSSFFVSKFIAPSLCRL